MPVSVPSLLQALSQGGFEDAGSRVPTQYRVRGPDAVPQIADGRGCATKRSHPGNETVAATHPNNRKTGSIYNRSLCLPRRRRTEDKSVFEIV